MRCIAPRTAGFQEDGKTLAWSEKHFSPEYSSFQIPCGKCLPCRLNYASEWATRAVHEASMYEDNSFITLTYNEENLLSDKLQYTDFQLFAKRLRKKQHEKFLKHIGLTQREYNALSKEERRQYEEDREKYRIGIFCTGEYGDKNKRPHWHALIFNYRPADCVYKYSNDRGDKIFTSNELESLWPYGACDVGSVTRESANYCARYAAKKLRHGNDGHEYEPISRKSCKSAIGKKYIEKHYEYVFQQGCIRLPDGGTTAIPRYYIKWLQRWHPHLYARYVTTVKQEQIKKAQERSEQEKALYVSENIERAARLKPNKESRVMVEYKILKEKFKQLQNRLKL